jgi:uncharacterized membrane protein
MTVGPLELVVCGFEGDDFKGDIARELDRVASRGIIRVVDLVFVRKDRRGKVTVRELQDLRDRELMPYASVIGDVMGLLTDDDVSQVGQELPPGTAAAVMLFEHTWATGLRETIQQAGGFLVASKRIPQDTLDELNAELATTGVGS